MDGEGAKKLYEQMDVIADALPEDKREEFAAFIVKTILIGGGEAVRTAGQWMHDNGWS